MRRRPATQQPARRFTRLRGEQLEPRWCLAEVDLIFSTPLPDYSAFNQLQVDQAGNSYVLTNARLIKYSPQGTQQWSIELAAGWLELDPQGNVIVGGNGFYDSLTFAGASGNVVVPFHYFDDGFVVKFNPAGQALWGLAIGGEDHDYITSMDVDSAGNVTVVGSFEGEMIHGGVTYQTTQTGSDFSDTYISRLSPTGSVLWTTQLRAPRYWETIHSVAVDALGNSYLSGDYSSALTFPTVSGNFTLPDPTTSGGMFWAKANPSGLFEWIYGPVADAAIFPGQVAVDPAGSVIFTGRYSGPSDFDPTAGVAMLPYFGTGFNAYEGFVVKLTSAGAFQWARVIGGPGSTEGFRQVAIDANSQIHLTGKFSGLVDFDPAESTQYYLNSVCCDHYLATLDADGDFVAARQWTGLGESLKGLSLGANGEIFLSGHMNGLKTVDLDPGPGQLLHTTSPLEEGLVWKLTPAPAHGVIESRVWLDTNANGVQDAAEVGIAGLTVELYASPDTTIGDLSTESLRQTTVTTDQGLARFEGLSSDSYFLRVYAPAGFSVTSPLQGGDPALDSNLLATGITNVFTVLADQVQRDVDLGFSSGTPNSQWAFRLGSTLTDIAREIVTDAAGNVFVTGQFQGTVDFDPGPAATTLTIATGGTQGFVAKYQPTGALAWVRALGYFNNTAAGIDLVTDAAGNVVVAVEFSGSFNVDLNQQQRTLIQSNGQTDLLLVKLSSGDGSLLWLKQIGGSSADKIGGLARDAAGNLLLGGSFASNVDFDPGPGTFTLSGNGDAFLLKLTTNGDFVWAKKWGSASTTIDAIRDVAVDAAGNVYSIGNFGGTADFDPGTGTRNLTASGTIDGFLSKLRPDGTFEWAVRFGDVQADQENNAIAVDAAGNVFIAGGFQSAMNFVGSSSLTLTSAGGLDGYVAKWSPTGALTWVRQFGGSGADVAYGLAVDADGAVYATGGYSATARFSDSNVTFLQTSAGDSDAFVQKWTAGGDLAAFYNVRGAGMNRGEAVLVEPVTGRISVAGQFAGTADLDPSSNVVSLTAQATDAFVTRFLPDVTQPTIVLTNTTVAEASGLQNVGAISLVGAPVGVNFTFAVFGGPAGAFWVENGQLRANTALLDFETVTSHTLAIRAFDAQLNGVEQEFTITVLNANEPPILAPLNNVSLAYGQALSVTATFTDPDFNNAWMANVDYGDGSGPVSTTIGSITPGVFTIALNHTYADGGTYTVTVTVSDNGPLSDTKSFQVTMAPIPLPTLGIGGSLAGVRGEPLRFSGSLTGGLPSGGNWIRWDFADGATATYQAGENWQAITHRYAEIGNYNVTITLTLSDGRTTSVQQTVAVQSSRLIVDPVDPNFTTLLVGGDNSGDVIRVLPGLGGSVRVYSYEQLIGTYVGLDRVELHGQGADDFVLNVTGVDLWAYGGGGNDALIGGSGNDVLLGEAGNDLLRGHDGRDISIGGIGSDLQLSDAGEDLVIGSYVQLANLQTGLADIQREWLSARPLADRISNLRGNFVGPHENGNTLLQVRVTVLNDAHSDRLYGGTDRDWFFAAEDADFFGDRTVDDVVDGLT